MKLQFEARICIILGLVSVARVTNGADLYPYGSGNGDVVYCTSDIQSDTPPDNTHEPDIPFRFNITDGLTVTVGGNSQDHFYISPQGFISDIAATGVRLAADNKRFPLNLSLSVFDNCDDDAVTYCFLEYYYGGQDWQTEIVDEEDDGDICVNGNTIPDDQVYDYSAFQVTFNDDVYDQLVVDPSDCVDDVSTVEDPVDLPNWMLAPFWGQSLEFGHGSAEITARQTNDAELLAEISSDVNALDSVEAFDAQYAFIITWQAISHQSLVFYLDNPVNTFQLALTSDGTNTFVVFNYNVFELGGGVAGFDAGDGSNYCSFLDSRTSSIRELLSTSNIGVPGRYVLNINDPDRSLCEPKRTEVPSCQCDEGWEGVVCDSSVDDCASSPCPQYSTCIDDHINFRCDYCSNSSLCLHNSTCEDSSNEVGEGGFNCSCVDGFTGDRCELCGNEECFNGVDCVDDSCVCEDGYSGTQCDQELAQGNTNAAVGGSTDIGPVEISGMVVGTVAAVAAAAGLSGLIYYFATRKRDKEKKVSPEEDISTMPAIG